MQNSGNNMVIQKQRGITFLGFLIVLAMIVFTGYIGMKLFPMYQEYFNVVSALKAVAQEPGIADRSPAKVREALERHFYISYIDSVKRENVTIQKRKGYTIQVQYEVRETLLGNLDVVASFDKTIDLNTGDEI